MPIGFSQFFRGINPWSSIKKSIPVVKHRKSNFFDFLSEQIPVKNVESGYGKIPILTCLAFPDAKTGGVVPHQYEKITFHLAIVLRCPRETALIYGTILSSTNSVYTVPGTRTYGDSLRKSCLDTCMQGCYLPIFQAFVT